MSYDGLLKRLNIINAPTHDPNNDWLPVSDFLSRPPAAQPLANVPLCPAEAATRAQKMQRAQMLKDPSAPPTKSASIRDAGIPTTRDPFEPPARYVVVENSSVINHSLVCPAPAFCTERCRMWSCPLWEQNEHEPLNNDHPMSLCRECKTILWLRRA